MAYVLADFVMEFTLMNKDVPTFVNPWKTLKNLHLWKLYVERFPNGNKAWTGQGHEWS